MRQVFAGDLGMASFLPTIGCAAVQAAWRFLRADNTAARGRAFSESATPRRICARVAEAGLNRWQKDWSKEVRAEAAVRPASGASVIDISDLSLTFETADGPVHALSDIGLSVERGEFVSLIGPVRLRQDHAAARHRRPRAAERRKDPRQRADARRGAQEPRLRLRLPGGGALSLAHHRQERRAAARSDGRLRGGAPRAGPRRTSTSSTSPASTGSSPGSFPAACSSAPRSPARSPSTRRCF